VLGREDEIALRSISYNKKMRLRERAADSKPFRFQG
jgi:hypothetical protein